jgi:DNA-directed RNA polymerase subunit RPC12/RpoP
MKYKCDKCGSVIKGEYSESPQYGSHYTVRCKCGNKGNSKSDWSYNIDGFTKEPTNDK